MRVLTSEMLQREQAESDKVKLRDFLTYVKVKGIHVAFQWRGQCLDARRVLEPLHQFLHSAIDARRSQHVPVRVALRFERCQLTRKTLKSIYQLLTVPTAAHGTTYLCETNSLRELSLASNTLHAHVLRELAVVFQDLSTRRIDGLTLDDTIVVEALQTPAYTAAFRQMLDAVLGVKATHTSVQATEDPGFSLSLENWTVAHAAHVDALTNAFQHTQRPLRALSLACWRLADATATDRFGRLVLSPFPTATDAFDLNVSCVHGPHELNHRLLRAARAEIVTDAAVSAHEAGQSISCRLFDFAEAYHDGAQLEVELSSSRNYNVRMVLDCGCCEIVVTPAMTGREQIVGLVEPESIADLYIDGIRVPLGGPSGIIIDGCKRHAVDHDRGNVLSVVALLTGLATPLTRLSVRHATWDPTDYERMQQWRSWSLQLQQFNGEGCSDAHSLFEREGRAVWDSLQVVNFTHSKPTVASDRHRICPVMTLLDLLPLPRLRSLRFAHNQVSMTELDALYEKLCSSKSLQFVDIRHAGGDKLHARDSAAVTTITSRIETRLRYEHVSVQARAAFLLVLFRIERGLGQSLARDVIASILAFADTGEIRVVLW